MKPEIRDTETVSNPCGARDARLGDRFTVSPYCDRRYRPSHALGRRRGRSSAEDVGSTELFPDFHMAYSVLTVTEVVFKCLGVHRC
jgi:hypothetical protein